MRACGAGTTFVQKEADKLLDTLGPMPSACMFFYAFSKQKHRKQKKNGL